MSEPEKPSPLLRELNEQTDIIMAYRAVVSLVTLALAVALGCAL